MAQKRPTLALTLGDPSGIGPEVVAKALKRTEVYETSVPFVIGTVAAMSDAARLVGLQANVRAITRPQDASGKAGTVDVLNVDGYEETRFPVGKHAVDSAKASHAWVERAARLCIDGDVAGMVTAPVNKEAWHTAGFEDTGHQEVFKRLTGAGYVATMLVSGGLRCMHLSTHKPLREACDYVTRANVLRAIRLTHSEFEKWGFDRPRIAVAGLNPHASDNGLIGREELDEIAPAVADAQGKDPGHRPGARRLRIQPGDQRQIRRCCRHVPRPGTHRDQGPRVRGEHLGQPWHPLPANVGGPWDRVRHRGQGRGRRNEHDRGDPARRGAFDPQRHRAPVTAALVVQRGWGR